MIAIPALDLRDGACVQLVGGRYDEERIRLADPIAVARHWARAGFRSLHVVDLDAATECGSNASIIRRLLDDSDLDVQIGGGVRDEERIRELFASGASRVIVGTRAIEEPEWLTAMALAFPRRLIVAADVSGRTVVTHGWRNRADREVGETIAALHAHPLAGVLVTAVDREGRLQGADLTLMRELVSRSVQPLYASGGIHSMNDLRTLAGLGIHAAILGMAVYTGILDAPSLLAEFAG